MAHDESEDTTIPPVNTVEAEQTRRRKLEHIEICLREDVQCRRSPMFEHVHLIHKALPEVDRDSIDLTVNFLGLRASAPLVIAAMTGGHPDTMEINRRLAEAAEELRIPIGVGSQRAAVEDPTLEDTFRVVREVAPSVPVIANIGATHVDAAPAAVEMIEADILAIHLNPLQEAIQPEGDCSSVGMLDSIAAIVESVDVPVMVKETGAGISAQVAVALEEVGVAAVDVGGVGGTSWAAVEYYRALQENDEVKAQLGLDFWDWGIPTALSVLMVSEATDLEIVATGGVRSGLDVAKAIALGATAAGVAYPLLQAAVEGTTRDVIVELEKIIDGLKTAMYLTGCQTVDELGAIPIMFSAEMIATLNSLGLDYARFTRAWRRGVMFP